MSSIGLIVLSTVLVLTSYIVGFVMGYEFNTKEKENDDYGRENRREDNQ